MNSTIEPENGSPSSSRNTNRNAAPAAPLPDDVEREPTGRPSGDVTARQTFSTGCASARTNRSSYRPSFSNSSPSFITNTVIHVAAEAAGRYDRGGRGGGGAGRGDVEQHGRDGSFRSSVRIIGLEALEDAVRGNEKPQDDDSGNGSTEGNGASNGSEDLSRQS